MAEVILEYFDGKIIFITQPVVLIPEPVRNKLQVAIDFNCIFWVNIATYYETSFFITCFKASTLVVTGCGYVADGPFGCVYTDHTIPIALGTAIAGSMVRKACIYSF